jgi:hypothetical protein
MACLGDAYLGNADLAIACHVHCAHQPSVHRDQPSAYRANGANHAHFRVHTAACFQDYPPKE